MKGILLLNGLPPKQNVRTDGNFCVCTDGAYVWAEEKGIKPDLVIGDFDSLGYVPSDCRTVTFPVMKNETDGEIAIKLLREKGCDEVDVYGAYGKRTDHFLGNLALLGIGLDIGVKVRIIGEDEIIFLGEGKVDIKTKQKRTISLVPYGDSAHIIDSKGLFYPLKDLVLKRDDTRGISNVAQDEEVGFFVKEGRVLVLESWRAE